MGAFQDIVPLTDKNKREGGHSPNRLCDWHQMNKLCKTRQGGITVKRTCEKTLFDGRKIGQLIHSGTASVQAFKLQDQIDCDV